MHVNDVLAQFEEKGVDHRIVGFFRTFSSQTVPCGFDINFWINLSECIKGLDYDDPEADLIVKLMAVDDPYAKEFALYWEMGDTFGVIEAIIYGKLSPDYGVLSGTKGYVLVTALAFELKKMYKRDDKAIFSGKMDHVLGFTIDHLQPELAIFFARLVLAIHQVKFDPLKMKNWDRFSEKYRELILA